VSGSRFGSALEVISAGASPLEIWPDSLSGSNGSRAPVLSIRQRLKINSAGNAVSPRESLQVAGGRFGNVTIHIDGAAEDTHRTTAYSDSFLKNLRTEQMAEFVPRYLVREHERVLEAEKALAGGGKGMDARTNPYDRLWTFGKRGPRVVKHLIKLLLTFSVIMLALCTLKRGLRGLLVEQHWTLLLMYIFIPLWFMWVVVGLMRDFCLVTCIETHKNHEKIVEVIVAQRNVKARRAFAALATLCFQLDVLTGGDCELPMPDAGSKGRKGRQNFSASAKTAIRRQVEDMYQQLAAQNQEFDRELRRIFDAFDTRKSGAMSREQLGALMNRISGREFSAEEVSRLYELMDFDGNGMVEYAEMAYVLLHQRAMSEHIDTADVVDKMWRIFPTEPNGEITADGIRATFDRVQLKWDARAVLRLLDEMDVDRNGSISRRELTDFINSLELHRNTFGLLAGT